MAAYYNEIDRYAAEWLRNLIKEGLIADGDVDERDIRDVRPDDVRGYTQCHWFAGIGGWSYALRLAEWPDARPVWTGSCPCQPFSAAGKGAGSADERHLWPDWYWLIGQCRPKQILGEQVASKAGLQWFDLVSTDLETAGYAVGAADLCAASVGAPHIRQRLWFCGELADADGRNASAEGLQRGWEQRQQPQDGGAMQLGHANDARSQGRLGSRDGADELPIGAAGVAGKLEHAAGEQVGLSGRAWQSRSSAWPNADWLPCTDGKARPVEPGTFPLAHGIPGRVGRLRAYGNAIVPQVAAAFIAAYMSL